VENDDHEMRCRIDFEPIGKRVKASYGTTVLEAAQQAGIVLASTCGGLGKCGRCQVTVITGRVSKPEQVEVAMLSQTAVDNGERLACILCVQGDIKVHIPPESLLTGQRLQLVGDEQPLKPAPLVTAHQIRMPSPSLNDSRSDHLRIETALAEIVGAADYPAEPAVIRQLSPLARDHQWQLTAFVSDRELIGLAAPGSSPLGVAIDLGTTKIAASLIDLVSGQELAVCGVLNPQIAYGEDLISRLNHALQNRENAHALAAKVRKALDSLIAEMVDLAQTERDRITDLCIVGNTAMTHLLLELPVAQLAASPYVAASSAAMDIKAQELNLTVAPGAWVHILPGIGGFVGADHVAMILASKLDQIKQVVLGIDIGTNSEIVLFDPQRRSLTAASCASGPAFEGGHIRDGMRAASGAIESVQFTEKGLTLATVDGAKPIGVCGSGIVDALAELHRWNVINAYGRLDGNNPRVQMHGKDARILLAAADQSGSGREVVLTQNDINEVQLAKGAIKAGLETLLKVTDTPKEAVRKVVVAGAFGSFLDLRNVAAIGMFPRFPESGYHQVGNAALEGAKMALVSKSERARARSIARQSTHLELSTYPKFSRFYALGMQFPDLPHE
jgi:uncharacterized 2Fe-2S/4Fe-4S cluster protein (DUF4445 family)